MHEPIVEQLRAMLDRWQLVLAVAGGIMYCAGYLSAARLLRRLNIDLPPTEIYAATSLFVTGLTTSISASVLPVCVFVLTTYGLRHWPVQSGVAVIVLPAIVGMTAYLVMPTLADHMPRGFQVVPYLNKQDQSRPKLLRSLSSIALAGICLSAVITIYGLALFLLAAALWLFFLLWGQANVIAGFSPGRAAQHPVALGFLITTGRVAPAGSAAPEFGDDAFRTGGLLLSHHDGLFYFQPGTFAQEILEGQGDWNLAIVPERLVITFVRHVGG